MARGQLYLSESSPYQDEQTGASVRQVTSHPSIHHHPFYYLPSYDDEMTLLTFVSHRTSRPEVYAEIQESGQLLQLTEQEGIGEWSVHPSHSHPCFSPDGTKVVFTSDRTGHAQVYEVGVPEAGQA